MKIAAHCGKIVEQPLALTSNIHTFAPSKTDKSTPTTPTPKSKMKKFIKFLPLLALTLIAFSCSTKESVSEVKNDSATPAFAGGTGINRPASQCGPSEITSFVDATGTSFGSVEILNDQEEIYFLISLDGDLVLSDLSIFYGNPADLPLVSAGTAINAEGFDYKITDAENSSFYTMTIHATGSGCKALSAKATIQHMDFLGNVWGAETVWLDGTDMLDGRITNYCLDLPNNQG
jgi:hypothetical protein